MTDRAKGIVSIIASALGFALMAFFVRLCDDCGAPVSAFQKAFFRNIIAFAIAAAVFFRHGVKTNPVPLRSAWLPLLMRCVFGSIGIFANFYALGIIQIGEAMTLNKTAPFFTVVFAWLFLKERANMRQLLSIAAAFAGAALVMKTGFETSGALAAILGLAGGLGAGAAYAALRRLGRLGVDSAFIVLVFSAFSTLASVPFMITGFDPMTWTQVAIMLSAGASAAVGQFGVTMAYRFASPKSIAVYDYTNVIFTAVLGYCFFAQVPDLKAVWGFAIIAAAALAMSRKSA